MWADYFDNLSLIAIPTLLIWNDATEASVTCMQERSMYYQRIYPLNVMAPKNILSNVVFLFQIPLLRMFVNFTYVYVLL